MIISKVSLTLRCGIKCFMSDVVVVDRAERLAQACLLNIFKKLKAKKTQPLKKLKGIFGQKTQCIGIFEALSNKLSVLEFFEASFSPLF